MELYERCLLLDASAYYQPSSPSAKLMISERGHSGSLNLLHTNDATQLVASWKSRARVAQAAHYWTAQKLQNRYRLIGAFTLILNLFVGFSIFITLSMHLNIAWLKELAGVVSLITAGLVGIQTFRRDGERAEIHKKAAAHYSAFQRELELYEVTGDKSVAATKQFLTEFNGRWSQYIKEAPTADVKQLREAHAICNVEFSPN